MKAEYANCNTIGRVSIFVTARAKASAWVHFDGHFLQTPAFVYFVLNIL